MPMSPTATTQAPRIPIAENIAASSGIAQPDRVEPHQHDVMDHRLGQVGHLAKREGDIVVHRQIGEQGAELEQHA